MDLIYKLEHGGIAGLKMIQFNGWLIKERHMSIPINKSFKKSYERYINQDILVSSPRPGTKGESGVGVMATVVNTLWDSSYTGEDVYQLLKNENFNLKNLGNQSLLRCLNKLFEELNLNGTAEVYLEKLGENSKEVETNWEILKKKIRSKNAVIIYHELDHYSVVCGFYEQARDTARFKNLSNGYFDRWDYILLAEQSAYFEHEPIRIVSLTKVRDDLAENKNHLLMSVTKK